jgi:hypothetical protein
MQAKRMTIARVLLASGSVLASTACTSLGPMPATTGVVSLPAGKPSFEMQAGVLPAYYLSSGVTETPKGTPIAHGALLIEPDRVIKVRGLVVGGRYVGGPDKGGYPEPMIGYRTYLGEDRLLAVSAVGYGTYATGSSGVASYRAARGGAEAGVDVRLTPASNWFELHLSANASLTGLSASGRYCLDAQQRFGTDCPDEGAAPALARAGGFYPAGTAAIAVDTARHFHGVFHGMRIALMAGGGTMPRLVGAEQASAHTYAAAGLSLTLGLGEAR